MTDAALTLRTDGRTELLPIRQVREVRVRHSDRLWNGLAIGTAAGALGGLVPDYYDDCEECHDALYGSIALGAGVGLLIDVLVRPTRVVYRAPGGGAKMSFALECTARRTAVLLSFRF